MIIILFDCYFYYLCCEIIQLISILLITKKPHCLFKIFVYYYIIRVLYYVYFVHYNMEVYYIIM